MVRRFSWLGAIGALWLLAACGGSCGTKCGNAGVQAQRPAPTPNAASTAAASAPQTATTPTPGLAPSTPITAPAFRAALIRVTESGGVPAASAGRAADCIIAGLPSLGIKTAGGFENAGNPTQVRALIARCVALVRRGR